MTEHITSHQNPLLVHIRKLLNSRSYREKNRQFAGEGTKLLDEAIRWQAALRVVLLADTVAVPQLPDDVRTVIVPADVLQFVSTMDAPQGAIFVCDYPAEAPLQISKKCLILDGIQDPGNVGTILRTADALEIPVVLSTGCADAYNPKTVRATMGALFRNPPQAASREDILRHCAENHVPVYATALSDTAVEIHQADLNGAVVIGSEGKGVCAEYLSAAKQHIIIPMNPRCESLNAAIAAAIVMWEISKN